ncbi:MAG: hypothetical protein ACI4QL_03725 [Candidatus Fimimonas sp.]
MDNNSLFILLILAGVVVLLIYVKCKFKIPKVGSVALVTGAVKSGKTTYSVALALSTYKRTLRRWKVQTFFRKLFRRPIAEKPLLYSNIPLAVPYVPVTKELLTRQKRFAYGSVVYLSEASLVADNSIYKNVLLSEQIMLFNKLFGHETCGGLLVYDTQAIGDLPAVTRRCLGQYFYVHHIEKRIPFFLVAYVRENRYSEDGSVVSVDTTDSEDAMKRVLIPKSVWKKFDCYCYSSFTDDLPKVDGEVIPDKNSSLTADSIISFKNYDTIKKDD